MNDATVYGSIKALHIVFVTSWFAGLFYLPRIYVNLAMVPADSTAERDRLLEFTNDGPVAKPVPFPERLDLIEALHGRPG